MYFIFFVNSDVICFNELCFDYFSLPLLYQSVREEAVLTHSLLTKHLGYLYIQIRGYCWVSLTDPMILV